MTRILLTAGALLLLALPQAAPAQFDRQAASSLTRQNPERPEPLPPEQAFPFFLSEPQPGRYRLTWNPAPGHYLYRHAFQFSLHPREDGAGQPLDYLIPAGVQKTDQFFGRVETYYSQVSVDLELATPPGPDARLMIQYQGCADWGFCYPPRRVMLRLQP